MKDKNQDLWAEEKDQANYRIRFLCDKLLFSKKSPYQKVEVYNSKIFGRVLMNDDVIMITEKDEFIYHEMISHVPLFVHPHPRKVLIIGGGDGGTAREVLKHPSIEICKMVEIDSVVIQACREHIPQTACSFSHPKMDLIIGDGVDFVKNTQDVFDIVIVDSTDPVGPAVPLFGKDFYQNVHRILSEDGLVTAQGESAFFNPSAQKNLLQITRDLFKFSTLYHYGNMSYPGGLWSFLLASKKYHPIQDFRIRDENLFLKDLKYYSSQIHQSSFVHPNFIQKQMDLKPSS